MSYRLVTRLEELDKFLQQDNSAKVFGFDTEGTGLNTRKCKLVGLSLSFTEGDAVYVPLAHRIGANLPLGPVWARIDEKMQGGYVPVFFNAKFDLNVLQVATKKKIEKYEDALELVYLADPDRKQKGLKLVAKEDLGMDMAKFESLFTEAERKAKIFDISTKSPARCVDYAAADADATLRAFHHFAWVKEEFPLAVKVDLPLIDVIRKMEHNGGLELNKDYIDEQIANLDKRADALREQIFRQTGYRFELNSPKQLGIALFEKMGIPSPGMTKSSNPIHITKEETLAKLAPTYPIVETVISYRKVVKAKSSYFVKLKRLSQRGIKPRFNFNIFAAPTFRFAAPGGNPDVDGATGVNIQAVSNGEARDIQGVDLTSVGTRDDYINEVEDDDILIDLRSEGIDVDGDPNDIFAFDEKKVAQLPYVIPTFSDKLVCVRETCKGCNAGCYSAGIDLTRRLQKGVKMIPSVRQAFRAPEGWKLVSFDYDRQELVIGANMSREPRWLRALAKGEDLHAMTAASAYNIPLEKFLLLPKDEYNKKRGAGKTLNFAIFYGATAYTLANKADLTKAAAEYIYDGFVKDHPTLMGWINKCHIFSRKHGYTTTYFGRRRWLKQFYDEGSPKMIAFANRSAVNTAIQGCLVPETRVLSNIGWVTIGDMEKSGKTYQVWTGHKWSPAIAVNRGKCQLAEIELSNGMLIKCDTRHKLKGLDNEWKEFKDLKPGDLVALPRSMTKVKWSGVKEWPYLLGRMTGDGGLMMKSNGSKEAYCVYGYHEKEERDRQFNWLKTQGFDVRDKTWVREGIRKPLYGWGKENGSLPNHVEASGFAAGSNSRTKRLPTSVWTMSPQQQREYLQGLLDADGSKKALDQDQIWLHMQNQSLLRDVQILAYGLGYTTKLSKTKDAWLLYSCEDHVVENRILGGKRHGSYPTEVLKNALPEMLVKTKRGDSVSIIARAVQKGVRTSNLTTSMADQILDRYAPDWERLSYAKISSIKVMDKEEDTFTLSVDDPLHQFVADGVIHKNTGAEITRMAMVRVAGMLKRDGYSWDQVRPVLQIHDELAYLVRDELVAEVVPKIRERMEIKVKSWEVQLAVGAKIGVVWGTQTEMKPEELAYAA